MKHTLAYDIVIIGAGIIGLTLANLLRNSGLSIAIVDQKLPTKTAQLTSYNLRVSAITPASQKILQTIGVWEIIKTQRVSPFHKMLVWDALSSGSIQFDSAEIASSILGYIVENSLIHTALYENLLNTANVNFIVPATLQRLELKSESAQFFLNNDTQLYTHLVVGADGAESHVRALANIELRNWSYEQTAIVATVQTEKIHQQTAWQIFLPTGPLAFLPLAEANLCSIVWSTSAEQAKYLQAINAEEFNQVLAKAFNYRLGQVQVKSERLSYPLLMRHAKNYVLPHLALIGDAAHTIHPLAGQGMNLGFADAEYLAQVILNAHGKKRAIGGLHTLRAYERVRKSENSLMLGTVEVLKHLFSNEVLPLQKLREFGMNTTNNIQWIKNFLMNKAIGKNVINNSL